LVPFTIPEPDKLIVSVAISFFPQLGFKFLDPRSLHSDLHQQIADGQFDPGCCVHH